MIFLLSLATMLPIIEIVKIKDNHHALGQSVSSYFYGHLV